MTNDVALARAPLQKELPEYFGSPPKAELMETIADSEQWLLRFVQYIKGHRDSQDVFRSGLSQLAETSLRCAEEDCIELLEADGGATAILRAFAGHCETVDAGPAAQRPAPP